MTKDIERRYSISEVSGKLGVSEQTIRRWEKYVASLKPARVRGKDRSYTDEQLEICKRIKFLRDYEKLTLKGIGLRIAQEMRGEGRPRTRSQAIALVDKIENEVRRLLDILDEEAVEDEAASNI